MYQNSHSWVRSNLRLSNHLFADPGIGTLWRFIGCHGVFGGSLGGSLILDSHLSREMIHHLPLGDQALLLPGCEKNVEVQHQYLEEVLPRTHAGALWVPRSEQRLELGTEIGRLELHI